MCSMHWKRWARAAGMLKTQPWSGERVARWQARQDQKRRTQVEPIRNQDVFERDGWICGICLACIDSELKWPDPMCATLDHVVPLSLGGDHTWENVRAAHARCNSGRGSQTT
jgi:5-methylcytosine-specific restriction endonuclease McrA